jgi:hypothetical protein
MTMTIRTVRAWRILVAVGLLLTRGAWLDAARLQPEAIAGWDRYAAATEARLASEQSAGGEFLGMAFDANAAAERAAVLAGTVIVQRLQTRDTRGAPIQVPAALVHHWRGTTFIRGVTLDRLFADLETGVPPASGDVLASRVLERAPGRLRVYLKLRRQKFVTVIYDTEHTVSFTRIGPDRASVVSRATRIAQIAEAGTPSAHALPPGDDDGFLWRLNAYWRYESAAGGVIAECESISLSREIPYGLQHVIAPLVDSTARESMIRALTALRARFEHG